MIDKFDGDYRWLSNFYPCKITINDYSFNSAEAAFQASKSDDPKDWARFQYMTPSEAKREGQKLTLPVDWNEIRLANMYLILEVKFSHRDLMMKLLQTYNEELIEGNHWNDTFWGVCHGQGQNQLGKLLMQLRANLQGDLPW